MHAETDYENFRVLLSDVHAFYRRDLTTFGLSTWWTAMRSYDFNAVVDALGRHTMNPDTGAFLPMPSDVVKMLSGRTVDAAQVAWSKVDRAVRHVGSGRSVVFDDALIHRVLQDMGGWTPLGRKTEDEWPFVAKEFETRYRGYAMRSERPDYPAVLIGVYEAENGRLGYETSPPMLVGDAESARRVMAGGGKNGPLKLTQATGDDMAALRAAKQPERISDREDGWMEIPAGIRADSGKPGRCEA